MRMLIAGGGTGGHLFPGVALAEEAVSRGQDHVVLFVGTRRGVEFTAIPRAGFNLELIDVGGLKGKGLKGWILGLLRIPRAMWQSRRIIRRFRPDLVVGVGGYASGPVVLTAALMRLPTVVLEQNALPGLTNRWLGKVARKVFVSFPESLRFFKPGRAVLLGNPVRKALVNNFLRSHEPSEGLQLLVFGGSQGASVFNQVMPETVALIRQRFPQLKLMHQTGDRDFEAVKKRYLELNQPAEVLPFIHDMSDAYRHADLVVARAGATTVAELSLCRKPSVLIPFPFAADNHQEVNAQALVHAGAAVMIRQSELTAKRLSEEVQAILADPKRRATMEDGAAKASRPESAREIFEVCLEVTERGRGRKRRGGNASA